MRPALKDLQKHFKSHLMHGDEIITGHIVSTQGLASDMRLAIYGNAYYARLVEALQQDYEAIHVLLGDDEFDVLCKRYIDMYPSRYPSLRWFGQHMSEFIAKNDPYCAHPYLIEMAVFEWCFIEAFDAEDVPLATIGDVAQLAADQWPSLKMVFQSSVQLFQYNWNILPVWKAATNEEELPQITLLDQSEYCLIWRQALKTQYRTLGPEEVVVLQGALAGDNFSQLCDRLLQSNIDPEQVPLHAASLLKNWLDQGLLSQLVVD